MVGSLLVVACRLSFPWPLRGVLELAFGTNGKGSRVVELVPSVGDPVVWLGASFLALALGQGLAEIIQRVSFARFSIGLVHDARGAAVDAVASPGYASRSADDPGDLIARVIGDSARLKAGLKGVLTRMTQNGVFFAGVAVLLIFMEPRLGLAFLTGGLVLCSVAAFGGARVSVISRRLRRKEGELAASMHRMLVREGAGQAVPPSKHEVGERAEAKTTKLEGFYIWAVHGVLGLTACSVLVLGLQAVRAGRLEPADLFTVLFYLMMVHNPTVRVARQTVRLGRVLASAERLATVLKRADADAASSDSVAARASGAQTLKV